MIAQVVNASNETILLADEQFLVVVDLLVFRPELDLQVLAIMTVTPEVVAPPLHSLAPPPSKVQAQIMPGRLVMVWPRWTGA